MKIIAKSSEDEMILEFLKAEIKSARFVDQIDQALEKLNTCSNIIIHADLYNESQNNDRKLLLEEYRGYMSRKDLFEDFPEIHEWAWVILDRNDMGKIRYFNYSYWTELSQGSGSPIKAADTINAGIEIYKVKNDDFLLGANTLKDGGSFPPMIMLTDYEFSRYIVLEGHFRMTAYGLEPDAFSSVTCILGMCDENDLRKWNNE